MTFTELAFSTDGRIDRATFWKTLVVLVLIGWIGYLLAFQAGGWAQPIGFLVLAALIWPIVTVCAKRWHDLDRSAWWVLLLLAPGIGLLITLAILGFRTGENGPNDFGYPMAAEDRHPGRRPGGTAWRPETRLLSEGEADLMAMLAKLAKCDGPITPAEIGTVNRFLHEDLDLENEARHEAIRTFRLARDSHATFEIHLRRYQRRHADDPHILAKAVDLLSLLAVSDGRLTRREALFLDLAVAVFGVSSARYFECKYGESGPRVDATTVPEEKEFARILGLSGRVSRGEIRKAYRGLVGQYHPDKVSHLGPRLKEVADQEIKKINQAYEYFRKKYDL